MASLSMATKLTASFSKPVAICRTVLEPTDRAFDRVATAVEDYTAKLWDSETGADLHTLIGHEAALIGLAFSPDSRTLTTTSDDRTVMLWDVATGQELPPLVGPGRDDVQADLRPLVDLVDEHVDCFGFARRKIGRRDDHRAA